MSSFSDVARRQTRLRGRGLGKLEGSDFKDIVKERSISKLARLKQQAQDANKKPKPEMPLEAPQQQQALGAAPSPPPKKPILAVPPAPVEPQPGLIAPGQEPVGTLSPEHSFGGLGQGDPATGLAPSMSMADAVGRGGMSGLEAAGRGAMVLGSVVPNPVTGPATLSSIPSVFGSVQKHGQAFEAAKAGKEAQGKLDNLSDTFADAPAFSSEDAVSNLEGLEALYGQPAPPSVSASPATAVAIGPSAGAAHGPSFGAGGGAHGGSSGGGSGPAGTQGVDPGSLGGLGIGFGAGGGPGVGADAGGCIIISACTDPYSYEVDVTRAFRDEHLTAPMLRGYYALARKVVPWLERFRPFKAAVKRLLVDRLIDYGEYILDLKPRREKTGSEAVSLAFLRLIGWIGKRMGPG